MSEGSRVALDWAELEDESGEPAVLRRVWAPTIVEALEAMVADRQTDETLEQIEQGAAALRSELRPGASLAHFASEAGICFS